MKIGIIVFSQTGNTLSAVEVLKNTLEKAGHDAVIERVVPEGDVSPGMKNVRYKSAPDPSSYEGLVFASPVQAFSLAQGMNVYMSDLPSLKEKKIALLLTKQLKFYWTGGNRAASRMKSNCESLGGEVVGSEIIIWSASNREEQVLNASKSLSEKF